MEDLAESAAVAAGTPPLRALEGVAESFSAAVRTAGTTVSGEYELAGARVALRFAGRELRDALSPAFAHLAVPPEAAPKPAALTVHLWDSASGGAPPPPKPSTPHAFASGAMFHVHEGPVRAVYEPGTEALSVLDSSACEAWYWVADVERIPFWDRASPMRQMLFWWLESRGYLQVHGSAVGRSSGGVLMVGRRGAGKSVTSLATLGSTLLFAADDYVAVSMDGAPRLASIYSSGKLVPEEGRRLLPQLVPLASNPDRLDTEKAVIFAHEHFPAQTTSGFPLAAILVPSVRPTQTASHIVEIPRSAAFAALAPSTIVQLRTAGQDELTFLSRLIAQVPSYGLELGTDTAAIAGTIGDFLAQLTPRAER